MKRNFKLIVLIFLVSILAMGCRQASIQEEKNENFQKDETQKEENRKEGVQGKTPANKEETTDEGSEGSRGQCSSVKSSPIFSQRRGRWI